MNRSIHRCLLVAALCLTSTGHAAAAAAERVEVRARDSLTPTQTLRGGMVFSQPAEWEEDPASGAYTARFVRKTPGCTVRISASIRGKATRATSRRQVAAAVGREPSFGVGNGRVGPFGVHQVAEGTIYGILVTRVVSRRFGHLRVFASLRGCSEGTHRKTADEIRRVLSRASSRLRVT